MIFAAWLAGKRAAMSVSGLESGAVVYGLKNQAFLLTLALAPIALYAWPSAGGCIRPGCMKAPWRSTMSEVRVTQMPGIDLEGFKAFLHKHTGRCNVENGSVKNDPRCGMPSEPTFFNLCVLFIYISSMLFQRLTPAPTQSYHTGWLTRRAHEAVLGAGNRQVFGGEAHGQV
jgi:hypothetical protein